jgi:hypothetical protein
VQEEKTSWRTANAPTHTPAPRGTYRVPQQQPHRRHASPRHSGLPPTTPGVDSATTTRPTGHVHTCQNDPTTCPAHHMSQLPCTGSHTGPRELRVGGVGSASLREGGSGVLTGGRDPKRGRIHALSQHPESPALRTSVCDAARSLRIGGGADLLHETLRGRAKVEPPGL